MVHLELNKICKGFDHPVIDRLSLKVDKGEFFVIVGPSGIGKTTLLRCIAGLEKLDEGEIFIEGDNVTNVPPYNRNVAMTFESYALYPHMTVFENIANPLKALKKEDSLIRSRVYEIAELLHIDGLLERKPHEISGDQKQRTALGRTLAAHPRVFLLDEPISHLDAKIRAELRTQFHTLEALREVSTVYVTHDYAEALSLGDRIGVMGNGGLVQIGTAHEIYEKPNSLFVAQHLGQPSINSLEIDLIEEAEKPSAIAGSLKLPVDLNHWEHLKRKNITKCTLGIRPQFVKVVNGDQSSEDNSLELNGMVEVYEALGAYGVMITSVVGQKLTVLTDPEDKYDHDENIIIRIDPSTFNYFDLNNGVNLIP